MKYILQSSQQRILTDNDSAMNISYYMPFKPMGHKNPSGDLIMGSELFAYLAARQHNITLASELRCRWIYYKPWKWFSLLIELFSLNRKYKNVAPQLWLTYHSYYKAPDILGTLTCKKNNIPYIIFQGIYSTKTRKKLHTKVGFYLNRWVLKSADLVLTNKKKDYNNLIRLLPEDKVKYLAPGLHPENFTFDLVSRRSLRNRWKTGKKRIVMTAAMFRPGVKTQGLLQVIDSCTQLIDQGFDLQLVIAGDGANRQLIKQKAESQLGSKAIFLGKIPRHELYRYYSAADVFAFPGIEESLGMVFLEAQSSGLPVVAFKNWGASEAVLNRKTGLLNSSENIDEFTRNIGLLLTDDKLRRDMRDRAKQHVRDSHDLEKNYAALNDCITRLAENHPAGNHPL